MPAIRRVMLSHGERVELEALLVSETTQRRLARRAQIILAAADGLNNERIARCCGCNVNTVRLWRNRWLEHRMDGLQDTPGRGRKRSYTEEREAEILAATLESPAPMQRWSARRLAKKLGIPRSTILRVWQRHGVRPHLRQADEPTLVATVIDLVGLYLDPRSKTVALWIEDQSRAEEQTSARLSPVQPTAMRQQAHGDPSHLPMELLAALNAATGEPAQNHRHHGFLRFLESIDGRYPTGEIHLILTDSSHSAHGHPKIKRWLARRPRYHLQCTPSSASWIGQVETWFSLLTRQALRSHGPASVSVLIRAVDLFSERWSRISEPFKWVKTGEQSLPQALLSRF